MNTFHGPLKSILRLMISESWAENPPPPFLPFHERPGSHHTCGTHLVPFYKSTLRFILSEFLLQVTNFVNFSKYSHIKKYRTQDHGAGGGPIGSLTTIHAYIPAMSVTLLAMRLWSVIMVLYVYACMLLTWYVTKLLVIHLEQSRFS